MNRRTFIKTLPAITMLVNIESVTSPAGSLQRPLDGIWGKSRERGIMRPEMVENIWHYVKTFKPFTVESESKLTQTWGQIKKH
jgi:hypothetical protein